MLGLGLVVSESLTLVIQPSPSAAELTRAGSSFRLVLTSTTSPVGARAQPGEGSAIARGGGVLLWLRCRRQERQCKEEAALTNSTVRVRLGLGWLDGKGWARGRRKP